MQTEDDIKLRAKELLQRLVQDAATRVVESQRQEVLSYYARKSGLFRALATRVLKGQAGGLNKDAAVRWSVDDLQRDAMSRTTTSTAREEFARWFGSRQPMLRGVAGRFYRFAQDALPGLLAGKLPAEMRRELGISDELLGLYLGPMTAASEPGKRTAQNLAAIEILASGRPPNESDRRVLAGYSGWGGLSIERVEARIAAGFRPDPSALIHEYYTPSNLCLELGRVLRRSVSSMNTTGGVLRALEPSAGIGRFVHALSLPGYDAVSWTAVEYSSVSAALLRALRPDIRVVEGSFEKFVSQEEGTLSGSLDLVVSNPPYGERGASASEDAHPDYRERKASAYFLRRGLDLLKAGGIGVFLIPYGFLTGQSPEALALRKRVLRRHHLMAAFRLPSGLFPGANLVTDLLLFRARGGELAEAVAEDSAIVEGRYFELFPAHLLGTELRGDQGGSDE